MMKDNIYLKQFFPIKKHINDKDSNSFKQTDWMIWALGSMNF